MAKDENSDVHGLNNLMWTVDYNHNSLIVKAIPWWSVQLLIHSVLFQYWSKNFYFLY